MVIEYVPTTAKDVVYTLRIINIPSNVANNGAPIAE